MLNQEKFSEKNQACYLVHLSNFSAAYQRDLSGISISIYVFSTFLPLQIVNSSLRKFKWQ